MTLDATDWALLAELQRNARASMSELARTVSMSASAVTERVRRLEDSGVLRGYRAEVDLALVGYPILAFVRLRYPHGNYKPLHDLVAKRTEILEAHHVTGDDCFVLKVAARSMPHLEEVVGAISGLGGVSTSIVYSTAFTGRVIQDGGSKPGQGRSAGGGTSS
jgi:Lrp/AsnC family transcriptional regulator, leucine-responsive regulatory protein